jgi:hypothetical protein
MPMLFRRWRLEACLPGCETRALQRASPNLMMGSFFRNPLGLFTAIVVVGLILIVAGMSAFGGTSSGTPGGASGGPAGGPYHGATPLSPAQFRRAGVRICLSFRSLDKAIHANGKPHSLRETTRFFRIYTPTFDRLTREVDELIPPPSAVRAAATLRRLRSKLDRFDRAMDHLDHFAETGQWRQFVLLARSRSFKDLLKGFGHPKKLRDIHCGQGNFNIA